MKDFVSNSRSAGLCDERIRLRSDNDQFKTGLLLLSLRCLISNRSHSRHCMKAALKKESTV